jgi:hypothetical protein
MVHGVELLFYKEKSFSQELEQFFREELDYVEDLRYSRGAPQSQTLD